MNKTYEINVAGLKRELPVFKLSDELAIAAFVIFGDVELTCACAKELIKKAPEHDIMITAEAKSIPLIHEMARQMGAALTEKGNIKVNEKMESTIPGLFAAGDCTGGLLQVAKAVYDGAQAGLSANQYVRNRQKK